MCGCGGPCVKRRGLRRIARTPTLPLSSGGLRLGGATNAPCLRFAHSLLVVAYEMLKHKGHYRELGADFFDGLNKDQVKRRLVQRLAKLGFQVTVTKAPTAE